MSPFEISAVLNSMSIIVDTREQDTDRARRRYRQMNRPIHRRTLNFGDYTYDAILPDGNTILPENGTICPKFCVIERKMDLDELAQCFTRSRKRFEAEFERAAAAGCRVYLVIENGSWEAVMRGAYQTKMSPKAFMASLTAWMIRYNAQVVFCSDLSSGILIEEILRRDLKERLERGEISG